MRAVRVVFALLLSTAFPQAAVAAPGQLDPTFGTGGIAQTGTGTNAEVLALQPDGGVLVAGSDGTTGTLARYTAAGVLDQGFGTGGLVTFPAATVSGIAVQRDGRILVCGKNGITLFVNRFLDSGAVDAGFGANGVAVSPMGSGARNVLVAPNGRILLGVATLGGTFTRAGVVAFRPDGSPDPSFGTNGVSETAPGTPAGFGVMSDGRIVSAGHEVSASLGRAITIPTWSADGVLGDPPAPAMAKLTTTTGPFVNAMALQADGRVIVAATDVTGPFGATGRLWRYAGKQADSSFGFFELSTLADQTSSIGNVAVQPDGKVLAAGSVTTGSFPFPTTTTWRLMRVTRSGRLDPTFNADPAATANAIAGIAIQADGKAVVIASTPGVFTVMRLRLLDDAAYDDPPGDADGDGMPNGAEFARGMDPAVRDNDIFANAELFAMQQYRDFLSREGDAGGIAAWTSEIASGRMSPGAVIERFFNSQEFQGTISPVTRLYFAYFLRIPDYPGLTYWIDQSRRGAPLATVSQAFAGSPEFTNRYGALDNGAFVDLVYSNVLGRGPDAGGKAYWQGELDSARMTRGEVMLGFSESPEYQQASFNRIYVTMMYVGMLRRSPDPGGFDFWVGYRNQGYSGPALVNGFLAAAEYRSRFLP